MSNFVGDFFVGELSFGFPDGANFGTGIDTVGDIADGHAVFGEPKDMLSGGASLHVGSAGERGESDHIPDGVNVVDGGLEILIDGDDTAGIEGDSDAIEVEGFAISGATIGPQEDIGFHLFSAFEVEDDPVVSTFDTGHGFVVSNEDT